MISPAPSTSNDRVFTPLVRTLSADFETPSSVYLKCVGKQPSFLLESVTGGEQLARYSFIGVDLDEAFLLQHGNIQHRRGEETHVTPIADRKDSFAALRAFLSERHTDRLPGIPRFSGGLVGYIGYNSIDYFEPSVNLDKTDSLPDALFLVADTLIAFDHAFGQIILISHPRPRQNGTDPIKAANARLDTLEAQLRQPLTPGQTETKPALSTADFESSTTQDAFERSVELAKEKIKDGEIFQVVLSQRLSRETQANPFNIYRALRRLNPSPYMFFFNFGDLTGGDGPIHIIGASPEMHVRLEDEIAALRPIAGTRKRGGTPAEDLALEEDLLADPKERAEHVMLVDLGRNDLGRISEYGSVSIKDFMVVERYSHVMHIVSQVEGQINAGLDGFDLMAATFPAGTVSGAPKIRAMQIIDELEPLSRGPYAGAVGYFSYDGSMDSCIAIRTLVMEGKLIQVQAGAGIVADSVPANEYQETLNKAKALIEAVLMAERGLK